jgi:hypothetical protein
MSVFSYYLIELQMGFIRRQWHCKKTRHTNTHHAQAKHSTQSCTNKNGHITRNEYNAKEKKRKAIPVTGLGVL